MTGLELGTLTRPAARPLLVGAALHAGIAVVGALRLVVDASPRSRWCARWSTLLAAR